MSKETSAILRAALMIAKTSDDLSQATAKIEALCDQDDIDAVEARLERMLRKQDNKPVEQG